MDVGDWAQILATLIVAVAIFRLERRNRDQEVASSRELEAKRERRAIQREEHKQDYLDVNHALSRLQEVFDQTTVSPWTREDFEHSDLGEATRSIKQIMDRVSALNGSLFMVWIYAVKVLATPFPTRVQFERAATTEDGRGQALEAVVREAVASGMIQSRASKDGLEAIKRARRALEDEWGAESEPG